MQQHQTKPDCRVFYTVTGLYSVKTLWGVGVGIIMDPHCPTPSPPWREDK